MNRIIYNLMEVNIYNITLMKDNIYLYFNYTYFNIYFIYILLTLLILLIYRLVYNLTKKYKKYITFNSIYSKIIYK